MYSIPVARHRGACALGTLLASLQSDARTRTRRAAVVAIDADVSVDGSVVHIYIYIYIYIYTGLPIVRLLVGRHRTHTECVLRRLMRTSELRKVKIAQSESIVCKHGFHR